MNLKPVDRCSAARSLLFAPANRPELFTKAAHSGADAVILDLEDAVPPADKPRAREAIEHAWAGLATLEVSWVVRINAPGTEAATLDLALLQRLPGLAAVMVPKAESAAALRSVHDRLAGVAMLPLIESAAGYAALAEIAAVPGISRLVLGHIDFMADTGLQCDDTQTELVPLRFAMAMATRLNRLAPAIDGVTERIGDEARLRADTQRALRFGFGGKLCIHPRQVATVHDALRPGQAELDWARRVIAADAAAAGAAVQLDGRMVDLPVVLQARRTLSRERAGGR